LKVKKYAASSMAEAMKQIRAELGSDAVILNSREVQSGGFFGFFKKKTIEVIAAVDQVSVSQTIPVTKQKQAKLSEEKLKMMVKEPVKQQTNDEKPIPQDELLKEVAELKSLLRNLPHSNEVSGLTFPPPLKHMDKLLNDQEIDGAIKDQIMNLLLEKWFVNGANSSIDTVYTWLEKELADQMSGISYGGISFKKKFINVVGPTGVGKTTTLAKIAADCVLTHKKKVAFLTTDTYRIAAIDQLKTYAKILNVPMEVCYTIEDFRKAAQMYYDYDVILIDTAGRNFRNREYVDELKQTIDFDKDMETFLVLSLTAKQRDMEDIYEQFSMIDIDKFIFTKADETSAYGAMYNLIRKYSRGAAYITNGQNVPDDMIEAAPREIAKMIIGVK
jgi:flagellar biosynthesis protein FlhF